MRKPLAISIYIAVVIFVLAGFVVTTAPSLYVSNATHDPVPLTKAEHKMVRFINKHRDDSVDIKKTLVHQARALARHLSERGLLYHRDIVWPSCWGQAVGFGWNGPYEVFRAFMRSGDHRHVLLDDDYHHAGIGIVHADAGPFWVVVNMGC